MGGQPIIEVIVDLTTTIRFFTFYFQNRYERVEGKGSSMFFYNSINEKNKIKIPVG